MNPYISKLSFLGSLVKLCKKKMEESIWIATDDDRLVCMSKTL